MALRGTIKDFGLADIFQLIGIQRKTGVLTLDSGLDTVTIKFLDGRVVGADTRSSGVEERLGSVLVRTGRITAQQLETALSVQKSTLQRLGYVLVKQGFIGEEDLVDALRVQSLQIVYRLFRWQDGKYNFQSSDRVEYDEQHFQPISSETILMEGARMIDEWPLIRRRIKSDNMVFRRTEAAAGMSLELEPTVNRDIDLDAVHGDGNAEGEEADRKKKESGLSPEEIEVLRLVDGRRTVEEITDNTSLGEFDTHRTLVELVTKKLIEEVERPKVVDRGAAGENVLRKLLGVLLNLVVVGLSLMAVGTLRNNPLTPWRLVERDPSARQLRLYASQTRLEAIQQAIEVFYLDAGAFPQSLELLAENGYLEAGALVDPWNRIYGYRLGRDGYELFGLDAEGRVLPQLTSRHRFTVAERMMVEGGGAPPPETMPESESFDNQ